MKVKAALVLIAAICFWSGSPTTAAGGSNGATDTLLWGQPSDGVQMSLSSPEPNSAELQVAFRNIGKRDLVLNLGSMLANGKVQLPDYISLNFTDAQGKTRQFKFADKKHSFVAGRVDDYIVPLRVGSTYTLKLTLDQFWCHETKEFEITLLSGKNRLTAEYQGSEAKLVNLDMPAIKLMNFWLGKVESNTLIIEP
jgi:hypothetical protein